MDVDNQRPSITRIPGAYSGSVIWDADDRAERDSLVDHPAVTGYGHGVSTEELASFVEVLASRASSRVRGVGAEQYGQGSLQKFETLTAAEITTELLDELADVVAYASMIAIRVARLGVLR